MAVVKGQAMRRRDGQSPNTVVMAASGDPAGIDRGVPCPVGRCKHVERSRYLGQQMDLHLSLEHPRHEAGKAARARLRDAVEFE